MKKTRIVPLVLRGDMFRDDIDANHFFAAVFTIFLSIGALYAFKALLPSEKLFAEAARNGQDANIAVDSAMLIALAEHAAADVADIVAVSLSVEPETGGAAPPPQPSAAEAVEVIAAYEGEYGDEGAEDAVNGMVRFFQKLFALEDTKKGSVRIAYFGDSMIEGDLIVYDLRRSYQRKFGGQGVGFVPLSSIASHLGMSTQYEYSPKWVTYSALKKPPVPFGINGFVSVAGADASVWTRYRGGLLPLVNPTLYYGRSENADAVMIVTADGVVSDSTPLKPVGILNKRPLASSPRELRVQFDGAQSIPFYGVNFSGVNGVNIDDFALRGSSGLPLAGLSVGLMNAFQREFGYDLLVLQFGANVLWPGVAKYNWYESGMTKAVNHLKKCFPGADVLVISQADKAAKYGTEMKTDTALAALLKAQERYARNTGAAFINLFQLMGGEGKMLEWANAKPSLAAADYTHFSPAGAKKIAGLIYQRLDKDYEDFKRLNNLTVGAAAEGGESESESGSGGGNESE